MDRPRKRLIPVLTSLLLGAVVGEIALRLVWENPYRDELPDTLLQIRVHHPFKNFPGDRSSFDEDIPVTRFRTDERSYILPSRRFENPDVTVAFLGASTTQCYAVQEHLRFHVLVSKLLEDRGLRVNTLNVARSANTTHDSLNVLLNHVVDDAPDVAIMMHATADVALLAHFGSYRGIRNGSPATYRTALRWMSQAASSRSWLVATFRKWATFQPLHADKLEKRATKDIEWVSLEPDGFVSRLRAFVGICRAFGIEPVLMTQPLVGVPVPMKPDFTDVRNQEVFNDLIRQVGVDENIVIIDLARHVAEDVEDWEVPMRVFYDGIHVTDFGSQVYGEYIARRLYEAVLAPRAEATASASGGERAR